MSIHDNPLHNQGQIQGPSPTTIPGEEAKTSSPGSRVSFHDKVKKHDGKQDKATPEVSLLAGKAETKPQAPLQSAKQMEAQLAESIKMKNELVKLYTNVPHSEKEAINQEIAKINQKIQKETNFLIIAKAVDVAKGSSTEPAGEQIKSLKEAIKFLEEKQGKPAQTNSLMDKFRVKLSALEGKSTTPVSKETVSSDLAKKSELLTKLEALRAHAPSDEAELKVLDQIKKVEADIADIKVSLSILQAEDVVAGKSSGSMIDHKQTLSDAILALNNKRKEASPESASRIGSFIEKYSEALESLDMGSRYELLDTFTEVPQQDAPARDMSPIRSRLEPGETRPTILATSEELDSLISGVLGSDLSASYAEEAQLELEASALFSASASSGSAIASPVRLTDAVGSAVLRTGRAFSLEDTQAAAAEAYLENQALRDSLVPPPLLPDAPPITPSRDISAAVQRFDILSAKSKVDAKLASQRTGGIRGRIYSFFQARRASSDRPLTFKTLLRNSNVFQKSVKIPTKDNTIAELVRKGVITEKEAVELAKATHSFVDPLVIFAAEKFLEHKVVNGSPAEKALYKNMTTPQFLQRLTDKRPLVFTTRDDDTRLRDGTSFVDKNNEFRRVGEEGQTEHLKLNDYLSYDEIPLAAMISVSTKTPFINDGRRDNKGIATEDHIKDGYMIAQNGVRLEKAGYAEHELMMVTPDCTSSNGYGASAVDSRATNTHRMWAEIYGQSGNLPSFEEAQSMHASMGTASPFLEIRLESSNAELRSISSAHSQEVKSEGYETRSIFLNKAVYEQRESARINAFLSEGKAIAAEGKPVFMHATGVGLGVWHGGYRRELVPLQMQLYQSAITQLGPNSGISDLYFNRLDDSVTSMDTYAPQFAQALALYSNPNTTLAEFGKFQSELPPASQRFFTESVLITSGGKPDRALTLANMQSLSVHHQKMKQAMADMQAAGKENGITVHFGADSVAKNAPEKEGRVVVGQYGFDGNALAAGNEYWKETAQLDASADPAAAACSLLPELQNPSINPYSSGSNVRIRN